MVVAFHIEVWDLELQWWNWWNGAKHQGNNLHEANCLPMKIPENTSKWWIFHGYVSFLEGSLKLCPGSPKTIFLKCFFHKDYCFRKGLSTTIPGDYSFNGLWLPGYDHDGIQLLLTMVCTILLVSSIETIIFPHVGFQSQDKQNWEIIMFDMPNEIPNISLTYISNIEHSISKKKQPLFGSCCWVDPIFNDVFFSPRFSFPTRGINDG